MEKKVLIVDDSRVGRKLVMRSLPATWQVEISEAADGEEAVAAMAVETYDVVFLDLTMPNLDGYGVLRWLKKRRPMPVVIVISGDLQPEAKVRALLLGAFEFLPKPPRAEAMQAVLKLAGVLQ